MTTAKSKNTAVKKNTISCEVRFNSEDTAFDAFSGLQNYQNQCLHRDHLNDLEIVSFEKDGNAIKLTAPNTEEGSTAINFVAQFTEETDLDSAHTTWEK